jgi:hypothetical protein
METKKAENKKKKQNKAKRTYKNKKKKQNKTKRSILKQNFQSTRFTVSIHKGIDIHSVSSQEP